MDSTYYLPNGLLCSRTRVARYIRKSQGRSALSWSEAADVVGSLEGKK